MSFAEGRSWEPGWLADYRKECWDRFSELSSHVVKDEKWRFSPRARFGIDKIVGLADPKNSLLVEQNSPADGISIELLDRLILRSTSFVVSLTQNCWSEFGGG